MLGFITKIFGGSKSEKDVKVLQPVVQKINSFFASYESISNDELRSKTDEFKQRIRKHLETIDAAIATQQQEAEALPITDINGREVAYEQIDKLKKDRDEQIEEVLKRSCPKLLPW
jgi:preprotein translocase subunit SecA